MQQELTSPSESSCGLSLTGEGTFTQTWLIQLMLVAGTAPRLAGHASVLVEKPACSNTMLGGKTFDHNGGDECGYGLEVQSIPDTQESLFLRRCCSMQSHKPAP